MADAEPTTLPSSILPNVVALKAPPKDRTNAERQRRYRQRKRRPAPTVTATRPKAVTAPHNAIVTAATLAAALSLAICSAGFSIYGLTAIFVGAFWPVVAMGAALELGKLSAVAYLSQRYGALPLRLTLVALVGALIALSSIGVYGFLSHAHIAHAVTAAARVNGKAADVDTRITVQQAIVADLDKRLTQIDAAVDEATRRGRTKSAMALADEQRAHRAELVVERTDAAKALAELQLQNAAVEGERKAVEADLGPVAYVSAILRTSPNETMRWFILAVALLLDPAAVLLLLAATSRR